MTVQGLMASSRIVVVMFLLGMAGVAADGRRRLVSCAKDKPCMKMTLYWHDILYNGGNMANATSAAAANATALGTSNWKNGTFFSMMVVFDDLMTTEKALPAAGQEPEVRGQGFYFYNKKDGYNGWFGFSIVFNSTAYRGTLNLVGADLMEEDTRDLTIVGGTGDFFMARGVTTIRLDAYEGTTYTRIQMDIKLYECYV